MTILVHEARQAFAHELRQLVGPRGGDATLLAIAAWPESLLSGTGPVE